MSIEWYAVHTYVGHEEKVRENIMSRAKAMSMSDLIYQVIVPTEETVEHLLSERTNNSPITREDLDSFKACLKK